MPILRQAPDNTLSETLGNLGNSLSNAFNPLTAIKSQNLQSEIAARQAEQQRAANIDAANRNAADVYERRNPFNEDPAALAVSSAKIRAGQGDLNSSITALTAASNFKSRQDAASLIQAQHPDWDQATVASAVADVGSGRKNLAEVESDEAAARLGTAKTGATIRGATAAGAAAAAAPNATPEAGPLAESEAYSDAAKAGGMVAGGRVRGTTGVLTPAQIDQNAADRATAGFSALPLGTAPTSAMQTQYDADTAAREGEIERQKKVGENVGGGLTPSGQIWSHGPPGSEGNPLGKPMPTTAPAPTPDVVIPNQAAPSAVPIPVKRTLADGTVITGQSPAEQAQNAAIDTATSGRMQEAIDAGVAGTKMLALIDRLRVLAKLARTGGSAQIPTWVDGWLGEHGLVMTDRQGILAEMKAEFKAQIPELRKDMGVKFEAGPELSAQSQMIGDPSLPEQVLEGIFARQASIAQLSVDRRNLAMRAYYPKQAIPLSVADYNTEEAKLYDNLSANMKQQMREFGAYTPESVAPPPVPRSTSGNSVMDAIQALLRHLGGADTQPPTGPTPPKAPEVWDVDKNGNPVRVPAR
jgi:hypothetical protein